LHQNLLKDSEVHPEWSSSFNALNQMGEQNLLTFIKTDPTVLSVLTC